MAIEVSRINFRRRRPASAAPAPGRTALTRLLRAVPLVLVLTAAAVPALAADWEAAIDRWTAAVAARPADARSHRELGFAYLGAAEARLDRADRRVLLAMADLELDQAVTLDRRDRDAKRGLARAAVLRDNLGKAIPVYEDLVRTASPQRHQDASQLFTLYLAAGMIERGLLVFEQVLAGNPRWHELRFLTALLYRQAGNLAEARRLLDQVARARDAGANVRRAAWDALREPAP